MSTHASVEAHGHGHHDPYLAHHFEDITQQEEAHSLGLWIFLATEVMFFGGLFLAFIAYHIMYPDAFGIASSRLSVLWGVINTGVLLLSSYTMAMGVWSAQTGRQFWLKVNLIATLLCAFAFMGVKAIEWTEKYNHHLIPGPRFEFHLNDPHRFELLEKESPAKLEAEKHHLEEAKKRDPHVERHAQMFFVMYFCLTGLHGFHVLCGIGVIGWILLRAYRGEFNAQWNTPVHLTGLYWHLVDIIWIFLFPVIYLIHRH